MDPSYRETPEAPPGIEAVRRRLVMILSPDETLQGARHDASMALAILDQLPPPARPLPDWMPTPEQLDAIESSGTWISPSFLPNGSNLRSPRDLVRAVRWFLEERENR